MTVTINVGGEAEGEQGIPPKLRQWNLAAECGETTSDRVMYGSTPERIMDIWDTSRAWLVTLY